MPSCRRFWSGCRWPRVVDQDDREFRPLVTTAVGVRRRWPSTRPHWPALLQGIGLMRTTTADADGGCLKAALVCRIDHEVRLVRRGSPTLLFCPGKPSVRHEQVDRLPLPHTPRIASYQIHSFYVEH